MRLYSSNPYRVLGILANASAPEKQKVKARIAAYIAVGKPPILDFDLCPPLEKIERTQELIDLKSNEILSDEDKLKHAIFWFISGGTIDDIALSNLTQSKEIEKARLNFEKGCKGFVITEQSITSIINHSTLEIINYVSHGDKERLKKAIENKLAIVNSESHLNFILNLLNPTHSQLLGEGIKEHVIEMAKSIVKDLFPTKNEDELLMEFFSGSPDVLNKIAEKNIQTWVKVIKQSVMDCQNKMLFTLENKRGKDILNDLASIGNKLLDSTMPSLNKIRNVSPPNLLVISNIYNEVFQQVNYCVVGASNKFQEEFGAEFEKDRARALVFVRIAGPDCYDGIVELNKRALKLISPVDVPIKEKISSNLTNVLETQRDWKKISDSVANGGGESSKGCGDSIGGCLGEIFERIIGIIIIIAFIALLRACLG